MKNQGLPGWLPILGDNVTLNQQTRIQQLIKSLRKMGKANIKASENVAGLYGVGKEQLNIANLLAEIMESE